MSEQNQTSNTSHYRPVPESVMTASRSELNNVELNILDGKLPEDISGHVFVIAPVGSVDSGGLPYVDGTPIFNGDGMIYRFDFDKPESARVTTKIAKTPDYYADLATRPGSKYEKYRFRNLGMGRVSLSLGLRNQLSTAFLAMKFSPEESDRLLLNLDGGRPYEIDPQTLETVTPVGSNQEWRAQAETPLKFTFEPVLSTAHPVFDPNTKEVFTVNYGRSVGNILQAIPLIDDLDQIPEEIDELLERLAEFVRVEYIQDFLQIFFQFSDNLLQFYVNLFAKIAGVDVDNFVYLIRWDGKGDLERWRVVLPDKTPVKIEQTMHQIGMSQDYVILMDTAFQFGLEQVINNPVPNKKGVDQTIQAFLGRPQSPNTTLYIIPRRQLKKGQYPLRNDLEVEVVAQKVVIPLETVHFLVDYENPDNQIILHLAHISAWDGAQWIRNYDKSPYPPHNPVEPRLHGMITNALDISRMGRYRVDADSGKVITSQKIYDSRCTWGIGYYAYRDLSTTTIPNRLENIYWTSLGLWKELISDSVFQLYKDYKYRAVPTEELLRLADTGIPAQLYRIYTSDESLKIGDRYEFPNGYMVNSAQFIPRGDIQGDSTDGYIFCAVLSGIGNEIWIFDAQDLASGPLCQLSHPSLDFGFTIHTAWLAEIAPRNASYHIGVRQDYQDIVKQRSKDIQELFEQEIYPHFEG
ncbi:MAG: carotenoid oxygenase family protein [Calothrix sp. MO_192.B10]|nr:carotenoid oxygenase family protein [Calothrix sp. MO_192.B10]